MGYIYYMDTKPEHPQKGRRKAKGVNTRRTKHIRMPDDVEAALKQYAVEEQITFNAAVVAHLRKSLGFTEPVLANQALTITTDENGNIR